MTFSSSKDILNLGIKSFRSGYKFDAESKAPIYYMGKKYEYKNDGSSGYHTFAFKITHGKLNYPSLVFIDSDLRVIQS